MAATCSGGTRLLTERTNGNIMDSRGAQLATYNPVQGHRLRHVELDVHVIKERVERKEVLPIWIDKNLQVADIFTKPLPKGLFQIFRNVLFGLRRAKTTYYETNGSRGTALHVQEK